MLAYLQLLGTFVANLFRPRRQLEVENLFLRHQLNIALRGAPHRPRLRGSDRALLILMTWLWPSLLSLSRIVQPDTILRWHRAGFRTYWRWKSRGRPGRPRIGRRMLRCDDLSNDLGPLWSHQSCPDCIIATRGYDFREGQGSVESVSRLSSFGTCFRNWVPRAMRWPSSRGRIWSWSASHRPYRGADREEVDEHGGLCSAKNPPQRPKGEARARQIGRSRGERARGRDGTATCGAVNEALSYCVTETPLS
jgi:hypothetical protein